MNHHVCKNPACGAVFRPMPHDVKRGWGKFCSKSCKAVVQGAPGKRRGN